MKGLLKFITCGSVDDGKSTLIGHILYDSKLLYADQKEALLLDSKVGSRGGDIDYSLLLDGLMAEREQGITIDVAYRYFTTSKRSFIVADTPGHEEYTRNMAVGASFAELAIILVDATKGVLTQTRRHARICKLMGIKHFIFAVNKMDLAKYEEKRFIEINKELNQLINELELTHNVIIPVSATEGDNVTLKKNNMPWYSGATVLEYLEEVDVDDSEEKGFYMPVQRVCRPDYNFRGFQGQIESGYISVGDNVVILPSKEEVSVKSILVSDKQVHTAAKGQAVTISLSKEVDISRGCVIEKDADPKLSYEIIANILWMNDENLDPGHNYLIKVGTRLLPGTVTDIKYLIDINTGEKKDADILQKNELAVCTIQLSDVAVVDLFSTHRALGEIILIDRVTNMTSACGVITEVIESKSKGYGRIDSKIRARMNLQKALVVEFRINHGNGEEQEISLDDIQKIERELVFRQRHTYLYHPGREEPVADVIKHLNAAGIIVLFVKEEFINTDGIKEKLDSEAYITDFPENIKCEVDDVVNYIYKLTEVDTNYSSEYII